MNGRLKHSLFLLLICACVVKTLHAQNVDSVRHYIKTLCSPAFAGRGYVNDGDKIAAEFIKKRFKNSKLLKFGEDYFQDFGFPVVYFPGRVMLNIDNIELFPGTDFIINPGCPAIKGVFSIQYIDSALLDNTVAFEKLQGKSLRNTFVVLDGLKGKTLKHPERLDAVLKNEIRARGQIYADAEKFTWSVSGDLAAYPVIYLRKDRLKQVMLELEITVESLQKFHGTQNVIGYLKGKVKPDSFVVFTAHYDHLGMLGNDIYFPGANDNASGVAMLLDLMNYFVKNPPKYSVAFIAFAGEEAGLLGSYYYVQNPLFPLKSISLLINLDLMGTGDKGMTVVNATLFPKEFEELQLINMEKNYLPEIKSRGKAQNSDHYFFSEAGVKAFFFYLMGDYHFYHDTEDSYEALTLSRYPEAFRLVRDFAEWYMSK